MPMFLPQALDTPASEQLRTILQALLAGGETLELDGSNVETVGFACLQVLIACREDSLRRGLGFAIINPSDVLKDALSVARFNDAGERVAQ